MAPFPTSATARPYSEVWKAGIIGAFNEPGAYIYNEALPSPIEVDEYGINSGQILKVKAGELNRLTGDGSRWGPGAPTPNGVGVDLGTPVTYAMQRFAEKIPEQIQSVVDNGALIPLGKAKLNLLASLETLKLRREQTFTSLCVSGSVGQATTLGAGAGWNETGGDPFDNIKDAVEFVSRSGHDADTMVLGRSAWWALTNNAAVKARMALTAASHAISLSGFREAIADLYGITRILVAKARVNTAAQGATASISDLLGDTCIIFKSMAGGERVSNEAGDVAVTPGWLARVRGYDLFLDNFVDDDAAVRWHRAQFAEALAVASTEFAAGIFNCVV
jgi:hypothetical protein